MNSEERHAARRARREAGRAARRAARVSGCDLAAAADLNALCKASRQAARGVGWKASTQRYRKDYLRNAAKARADLLEGRDFHRGFSKFHVNERGKDRFVSAPTIPERVIQKSINQNALLPSVRDTLIYDNGANIEGKGISFAVSRLKKHLADHYRLHGAEGYILLGDLSRFFDSIPHDESKKLVRRHLDDGPLIEAIDSQIDHQPEGLAERGGGRAGGKRGSCGLTLGSEINQTLAVAYPSRIDHFVTECCEVEAYARYNDDFYAIHTSKGHMQVVLGCIEAIGIDMGLTLNPGKTQIVKLSHGFTYLKHKFSYGENGRIVVRPTREKVVRERRKLKAQHQLWLAGEMTLEQVRRSYRSWRGGMLRIDAHRTVLEMDRLFRELFGNEYPPPRLRS